VAPTYILLTAPVIGGVTAVGSSLTVTTSEVWDPPGVSTGSMWQRSPALPPNDSWTDTGDIDNTYAVTSDDLTYYFRLRKRSPDGVTTVFSNTLGPIVLLTTSTSTTSTTTSTTSTTTEGPTTTTTSTTTSTTTQGPPVTMLFLDSGDTTSYNTSSAGLWLDLSGNNRDASTSPTSVNITYTSAAGVSRGLNFDRTTGSDFFLGTNSAALGSLTGDMSLEIWFSLRNPPTGTHDLITLGSSGDYTFNLSYDVTKLYFSRGSSSIETIHNINLSIFTNPVWYQVVATSQNGVLRIYLNGTLVQIGGTAGTVYPDNSASEYRISDTSRLHDGKISIVKVFDRALSPTEISTEYNLYKTRHGLT
jgi:hypothetical protein